MTDVSEFPAMARAAEILDGLNGHRQRQAFAFLAERYGWSLQPSGKKITCPVAFSRLWRSIAELDYGPWWRVTVNGKPNPKMPGGITAHREQIVKEQAHGSSI